MPTGRVKYFNNDKGYGFIAPHDGSKDVFAHRNECGADRDSYLQVDDEVTYEVAFDEKKGKDAATTLSPWRTGNPDSGGGGGGGGSSRESEKPCRDFLAGKCNRDRCKFAHDVGGRGRSRSRDRGASYGYGHPQPGYGYPAPGFSFPGYGACNPGYGSPGLPPGWEQHPDPATGRPYYCNRATGETSWTPPAMPSGPSGGGGPGGNLPPGWEEARDPQSGKTYYFNRATNTTQWTPP